MTVEDFRKKVIALIGPRAETWGAVYMLAALRHHGPAGEALRQAFFASQIWPQFRREPLEQAKGL